MYFLTVSANPQKRVASIICSQDSEILSEDFLHDCDQTRAVIFGANKLITQFGAVNIATDNQFIINVVEDWLQGWINNNFRKSNGDIVSNADLISKLAEALKNSEYPVRFSLDKNSPDILYIKQRAQKIRKSKQ